MHFEAVKWRFDAKRRRHPCVVLERGRVWDDYGYKTTFTAYYAAGAEEPLAKLGIVKILQRGKKETKLPGEFTQLSPDHCSLFQDIELYVERFYAYPHEQILRGLRDAATDPLIHEEFKDVPGFKESLLRFAEAEQALRVLGRTKLPVSNRLAFRFRTLLLGFSSRHELEINFDPQPGGLGRVIALIGANGCGKTQLLASLSLALSGLERRKDQLLSPERPEVSSVLVVSYSAFDRFSRANEKQGSGTGYIYCGLRDASDRINLELALKGFERCLYDIRRVDRWGEWVEMLKHTRIPEETSTTSAQINRPEQQVRWVETLSSGHKLVTLVLAKLLANLKESSLVLFDEPEIHLHPPLLSRVLSGLHALLDRHRAYAIVATHSPMVIQAFPSRFVQILGRVGKAPFTRRYEGESFGETLTSIVERAFGVGEAERSDHALMRQALKGRSREEVEQMVGGPLSLGARITLDAMAREESPP